MINYLLEVRNPEMYIKGIIVTVQTWSVAIQT